MKRYVVLAISLLSIGTASAWNKFAQQCIATLAEQNLTEKAKSETTKILGGDLASGAWWLQTIAKDEATKHTASWHYINVTADLKSTTSSQKDGVVQIENCIDILTNRAEHSDSTVVAALKWLFGEEGCPCNILMAQVLGLKYYQSPRYIHPTALCRRPSDLLWR